MNTVRLTPEQFASLRGYLLRDQSVESAALATAGYFRTGSGMVVCNLRLICRDAPLQADA